MTRDNPSFFQLWTVSAIVQQIFGTFHGYEGKVQRQNLAIYSLLLGNLEAPTFLTRDLL